MAGGWDGTGRVCKSGTAGGFVSSRHAEHRKVVDTVRIKRRCVEGSVSVVGRFRRCVSHPIDFLSEGSGTLLLLLLGIGVSLLFLRFGGSISVKGGSCCRAVEESLVATDGEEEEGARKHPVDEYEEMVEQREEREGLDENDTEDETWAGL